MSLAKIHLLIALLFAFSFVSAVSAEFIDFEQPTYPDASALPALNGLDGWAATGGWILFDGPTATNTSQVMWNNGGNGETAERTFAPLTSGTISYDVRPNPGTSGGGALSHWLVLFDSPITAPLLQLRVDSTGFSLISAGGTEGSGTGPNIEFSSGNAWYNVQIDFDLSDTTAGSNGTFDLQVTRLDGAFAGTVVWDLDDREFVSSVSNVGVWKDNGSTAQSGAHATLIDNINFDVPEPATLGLALVGGGFLLLRHRS